MGTKGLLKKFNQCGKKRKMNKKVIKVLLNVCYADKDGSIECNNTCPSLRSPSVNLAGHDETLSLHVVNNFTAMVHETDQSWKRTQAESVTHSDSLHKTKHGNVVKEWSSVVMVLDIVFKHMEVSLELNSLGKDVEFFLLHCCWMYC